MCIRDRYIHTHRSVDVCFHFLHAPATDGSPATLSLNSISKHTHRSVDVCFHFLHAPAQVAALAARAEPAETLFPNSHCYWSSVEGETTQHRPGNKCHY